MNNTDIYDEDLNPILSQVENEDLETIVDYLKTKMSEFLTVSDAYKEHYPNHQKYADLIAKEVRDMGGNSFANLFRGEGPTYKEIVCDVADKLKVSYNKTRSTEDIENAILEKILTDALESMSDEEKKELLTSLDPGVNFKNAAFTTAAFQAIFRAGGFKSYQLTVIIANQIAKLILGHGLRLGTGAALTKAMSVLTGPIGWAVTCIWTAIDLAGPSYKVTIPCVIHTAMLRKKVNMITCGKCDAQLTTDQHKFCPECGEAIIAQEKMNREVINASVF